MYGIAPEHCIVVTQIFNNHSILSPSCIIMQSVIIIMCYVIVYACLYVYMYPVSSLFNCASGIRIVWLAVSSSLPQFTVCDLLLASTSSLLRAMKKAPLKAKRDSAKTTMKRRTSFRNMSARAWT